MGEVESGAPINFVTRIPIIGSDDALVANSSLDVVKSCLGNLAQEPVAKSLARLSPIHIGVLMSDWGKNVERAQSFGCKRGITDARILHIERRVFGQDMLVFDLGKIPGVILGDVNVVMRQIELAFNPEVHHESGTGEFLARDFSIGPPTPKLVRNQPGGGASEVGIEDDGVGRFNSVARSHSNGASSAE